MRARALALLLALGAALALRGHSADLSLRPTFGGALLEGRITGAGADELTGVWEGGGGRARLLRCAPRCTGVTAIPLQGTLPLNADTPYRVTLGGTYRTGGRAKLTLRFRHAGVLNVDAPVSRP